MEALLWVLGIYAVLVLIVAVVAWFDREPPMSAPPTLLPRRASSHRVWCQGCGSRPVAFDPFVAEQRCEVCLRELLRV